MAISILYNPMPTRLFEADGDFASGAKAYFYLARTTTPMAVYTDAPLMVAHTWPVIADAYGLLPPVYIQKGDEYKVRIEDALGSILYAADGIDNPADPEATGGEGGGVAVAASEIFQTGDVMWNPASGTRGGWVRCNGRTISKGIGTGDEAHDDDCHDLFAFLWNNFPDYICPVTPGPRGPNPTADWDVAKSIATLDMRGFGTVGLDDMGNTARNLIQKQTTITTTLGSPTATVASAAGLTRLMRVVTANFPNGTAIVDMTGTTLTMEANATASGSDMPARFSVFYDAQMPGIAGGAHDHLMTLSEMVAHSHTATVTDPTHGHGLQTDTLSTDNFIGSANASDGAVYDLPGGGSPDAHPTAAHAVPNATGITVSNASVGGGMPINIQNLGRLGTFYIKK
jgi:hypothetical protein